MTRLLGVTLPDNKNIDYALTLIFGIGWATSKEILDKTKIDSQTKVGAVTEDEFKKIMAFLDKTYKVEGDLREELTDNIKRLREIGSYRGMRHSRGLPSRGQRTKSNGRTKKGKRKTVGALKKEVWAKMEQSKTAAPAAKK